jgi:DNA transposition AAA+ family ATPase
MLTTEQKQMIADALKAWFDRSGDNTYRFLADQIDMNISYVSKIANGELNHGKTLFKDEYFHKIADAIGYTLPGAGDMLIETKTFKRIQDVCRRAQAGARPILIDGDTGTGKTHALEHYAKTHEQVVYVKATTSMSPKDLLSEILSALDVKQVIKGLRQMLHKIKDLAARRGWLIIIDEGEDLKTSIYKTIKEIYDFCQNKAGIVLAGIDLIKWLDTKSRGKKNMPYTQLNRRFKPGMVKLEYCTPEEIKALVKGYGFSDITAQKWWAEKATDMGILSNYLNDFMIGITNSDLTIDQVNAADLEEYFTL